MNDPRPISNESTTRQAILRTYEEIAEDVEERRQTPWADVEAFEKTLPRNQLVLDMGCGTGRNALHYALIGHRIIALDFSRRLTKQAVNRLGERSVDAGGFVQADVTAMPIRDSSVDACLYVATLHHLPSKEERLASLAELRRCIKPGGKSLVSVWALEQDRFKKFWREGHADILVPIKTRNGRAVQRFYHLFVEGELDELVRQSGLEIERCFKSHDNYFIVAVRPNGL